MTPIFFIPIRSGSKGLPDKNVLMLNDKPLVFYTIEAVLNAGFSEEHIYVSSDSLEYLNIVGNVYPKINLITRSIDLSDDKATTFDVLTHFLKPFLNTQIFVLLQATSPFRTGKDIVEALNLFDSKKPHSVVSVSSLSEPVNLITDIDESGMISAISKVDQGYHRQDSKEYFVPNGSLFISKKQQYLEYGGFFSEMTLPFQMSKISSIDIDDINDFKMAIGISKFISKSQTNIVVNFTNNILLHSEHISKSHNVFIGDSRMIDFDMEGIVNLSVGGLSIDDVQNSISEMELEWRGKNIWINIGVNDFKNGKNAYEVLNSLKKLINQFKRYKVNSVYIFPIIESFKRFDINNNEIRLFNENLLDSMSSDFVTIINDFNTTMEFVDTTDGLHFSKAFQMKNYDFLQNYIYKYI